MRGIAALAIVVFHFMEWIYSDPGKNFIGHGFLAVDFFFCLSGFVIPYAYDNRIVKMGKMEFFKSRLIRLHPLVIFGSVLGLLGLFLDPFSQDATLYSPGKIAILFICSIFLIPYPAMEERAFNLFGLNAPSWSLFWEYAANIFYVFLLYRIGRRYLGILLIPAAVILCIVGYRAGNLLGGWTGSNFWDGGARIFYSFLAGMLIYRSNWIIKTRLGFIELSILLSLAFIMPSFTWNWLAELVVVLFYFPLLISLGAGSTAQGRWKKVCNFSGNISYPLYMTHYAAIWIFGHYFTTYKPGTQQLAWIVITGTILLVGFSYLIMIIYDIPVRRYLAKQRRDKISQ